MIAAKMSGGGSSLPVVDETAIVYKTGIPANTLTLNVDAFTTARAWAFPNAASTFAGLSVAQTFTANQTISTASQPTLYFTDTDGTVSVEATNTASLGRVTFRMPNDREARVEFRGGTSQIIGFAFLSGTNQLRVTMEADGDAQIRNFVSNKDFFVTVNSSVYGSAYNAIFVDSSAGNVGIGGVSAPAATLHVDQSSATGTKPVLLLDQADLSEEFIEFTSTVGAGNPIDTAALGAYYGKVRVMVTGVGYKTIALYDP